MDSLYSILKDHTLILDFIFIIFIMFMVPVTLLTCKKAIKKYTYNKFYFKNTENRKQLHTYLLIRTCNKNKVIINSIKANNMFITHTDRHLAINFTVTHYMNY